MSIKEMWKYLMFQTKGYRMLAVAIVLGAISGTSVSYINSFWYARILNHLLGGAYETASKLVITMIVFIWIIRMLDAACRQIFAQYAEPSQDETKKRTARKAFSMEYEELEKEESLNAFRKVRAGENGSGGIEEQLEAIYDFFSECVKIVFALLFLVVLVVQASLQKGLPVWKMAVMTILLVILFVGSFWINFLVGKRISQRQVELNLENERVNSIGMYLYSVIEKEQNAKDIRLYQLKDYLCKKEREANTVGRTFTRYGVFLGKHNGFLAFVMQVLAGYIYIYVAMMAMSGSITTGEVLMYAGAILTMMAAFQQALLLYSRIKYTNEYLSTYEEFINRPNMHYDGTLPIEKRDDNRYQLSFQNVSFRYPGTEEYILKNVSLTFEIGQKVALVGMNGAGKTTLIKLLLRLYEPSEGRICLNGIDIGKYDYDEYLQIFSVVFQDFRLFDFPLDENIACSDSVDEKRVASVLLKTGLRELAAGLPEKEHTLLYHENGEGVALSGGEAQKVAIARALYKDAPFVILDEPTAALDPIAEAEIYENFDMLVGDKTAIYISHRMSSCKFCDRIIVLNQGSIAEEGTHTTLLNRKGIYANLFETQAEYYG